jgi:hypothetical protein
LLVPSFGVLCLRLWVKVLQGRAGLDEEWLAALPERRRQLALNRHC